MIFVKFLRTSQNLPFLPDSDDVTTEFTIPVLRAEYTSPQGKATAFPPAVFTKFAEFLSYVLVFTPLKSLVLFNALLE